VVFYAKCPDHQKDSSFFYLTITQQGSRARSGDKLPCCNIFFADSVVLARGKLQNSFQLRFGIEQHFPFLAALAGTDDAGFLELVNNACGACVADFQPTLEQRS
jgi:hypothetical protein